jgi:hypothetical protein
MILFVASNGCENKSVTPPPQRKYIKEVLTMYSFRGRRRLLSGMETATNMV